MKHTPPPTRRLVQIRLSEIPYSIRRRYGRVLIDRYADDGDLLACVDMKAAVESPSDRLYWVPEVPEVMERIREAVRRELLRV